MRRPGGEPLPLPADQSGGAIHRGPLAELRHLPASLAGAIQQTDIRNALHCGSAVCGMDVAKLLSADLVAIEREKRLRDTV